MSPLIILAVGFLLIFLEFFLPGAILGTLGLIFVVASIVLFGMEGHSALAVLLFIIVSFVGIGLICWTALAVVRRSKSRQSFYSNDDQQGYVAVEYDHSVIGREATVLSDLKPSGHILIDKKSFQALSQSGYIEKGCKVQVIGGQGAHLLVKLIIPKEGTST
jgi:membrane-bound ClpP family serine protease